MVSKSELYLASGSNYLCQQSEKALYILDHERQYVLPFSAYVLQTILGPFAMKLTLLEKRVCFLSQVCFGIFCVASSHERHASLVDVSQPRPRLYLFFYAGGSTHCLTGCRASALLPIFHSQSHFPRTLLSELSYPCKALSN